MASFFEGDEPAEVFDVPFEDKHVSLTHRQKGAGPWLI